MAFNPTLNVTHMHLPAKLEILRQATGTGSWRELAKALIPVGDGSGQTQGAGVDLRIRQIRLADNMRHWCARPASTLRNHDFFRLLVAPGLGLFESVSHLRLSQCDPETFMSYLTEKYRNKYRDHIVPAASMEILEMPRHCTPRSFTQVKVYPDWMDFWHIVTNGLLKAGTEKMELRMLTTSFNNNAIPEQELLQLLRHDVRIRIILTDPETKLLEYRHAIGWPLMAGWTIGKELKVLKDQIESLKVMRQQHTAAEIDFRLSNVMPYGFLAHASSLAVVGWFLADRAYSAGRMQVIDGSGNAEFLKELETEWEQRWINGREVH